MQVGRVAQDRKRCFDLAERKRQHPFHGSAVNGYTGGAEAGVEQKLNESSAKRMPHDDWLGIECRDDLGQVIEYLRTPRPANGVGSFRSASTPARPGSIPG
jgi:hypothetical protein